MRARVRILAHCHFISIAVAVFSSILHLSSTASAADPDCETLNHSWKTKYYKDFGVQWPLVHFRCPTQTSEIALTLYHLEHLKFTPNSKGYSPNFYSFAKKYIEQIAYLPKDKDYPNTTVAAAGHPYEDSVLGTIFGKTVRRMTLNDIFFFTDESMRASTIVHEASHFRPDDPSHVNCSHGDMSTEIGNQACDAKFYDTDGRGSGYNYDFIFHAWVRDHLTNNELEKSVSNEKMTYLLLNRFNEYTNDQVKKWILN